MGGKPLVPHCPMQACRDKLQSYNYWHYRKKGQRTALDVAVGIVERDRGVPLQTKRIGMPTEVVPRQERMWRTHRRTKVQTLLQCPECGHEWWSTVG